MASVVGGLCEHGVKGARSLALQHKSKSKRGWKIQTEGMGPGSYGFLPSIWVSCLVRQQQGMLLSIESSKSRHPRTAWHRAFGVESALFQYARRICRRMPRTHAPLRASSAPANGSARGGERRVGR